jgi:hypothetical protein
MSGTRDVEHSEFTHNLRGALADLHDPVALRRNPLTRVLAVIPIPHGWQGSTERLTTAVEALAPELGTDIDAPT